MAASNLANVSRCPKLLRTVIKPSTFTCGAPALGVTLQEVVPSIQRDHGGSTSVARFCGGVCECAIARHRFRLRFDRRLQTCERGSRIVDEAEELQVGAR